MPITGKQFELGIDSAVEGWMRKIHSFLDDHRDEAFTKYELAEQVNAFTRRYKEAGKELKEQLAKLLAEFNSDFELALDRLLETGAVDTRLIRGETYYRVGPKPLPI